MSEYTYESEEQLNQALAGDYGEDLQEDAELFAAEHGIELVAADEPSADYEDDFDPDDLAMMDRQAIEDAELDHLAGELAAVEQGLGSKLTLAEQRWLAEQPPQTIAQYSEQLAARRDPSRDDAMRLAMMTERADDVRQQAEAAEPEKPEPPMSDEVDLWTETDDSRLARMAAAADTARELTTNETASAPAGLAQLEQEA